MSENGNVSESTAFHEAGHAVMAALMAIPVDRISIEPDEAAATLGHIIGDVRGMTLFRFAVISMAGPLAEAMYHGAFTIGADFETCFLAGRAMLSGYEQDLAVVDDLKKAHDEDSPQFFARFALSNLAKHWKHVMRVADALKKHRVLKGKSLATVLQRIEPIVARTPEERDERMRQRRAAIAEMFASD